ncbi:MAG TPA: hypothetical protein VL972_05875 [Solirubrobacteraceae bacterium]|nr:hypothetical protein [Solirubrobacteraceae bacterium]
MSGGGPQRSQTGEGARELLRHAAITLALGLCASLAFANTAAAALPDGRSYELVSRYTDAGHEVGLDGELPDFAAAATSGEAVNWEGVGGCCGAGSAAVNLYRSQRTPEGWQTEALTPTPPEPVSGFFEAQQPVFWTADLRQTIFQTPVSYASGVDQPAPSRPAHSHAEDLYLQSPEGTMTWLSRGPTGTGMGSYSAELDAATPDASAVVFSSAESLTPGATGLEDLNYPPQFLYLRDVAAQTTTLLDVKENALVSLFGAILGAGNWLKEELVPPNYQGSTTHALATSEHAIKAFFESPPPRTELEGAGPPHLYMREIPAQEPGEQTAPEPRTVEIDQASSAGEARYEGAAEDGSLVFFTSDEGLAGASSADELYEFDTTSQPIGAAAPMSVAAIGGGSGVLGVSAIANDGAAVYFVATDKLGVAAPQRPEPVAGQPNLYRYATATGLTTFIATLSWPDVNQCDPDCGRGHPAGLVAEPDVIRPAYPTPDGSVLAFSAYGDLTGKAGGARTDLTAEAITGEHTLTVASTAGFAAGQRIAIGSGADEEIDAVQSVEPPPAPGEAGHLTLVEYGPDGLDGLSDDHPTGEPVVQLHSEVYRYSAEDDTLACLSCAPEGVAPAGNATLGPAGGGSYAPPGKPVALSEDGSRVFFESPDPLLPEVSPAPAGVSDPPDNVYEWENDQLQLISNGSNEGFHLDGTTASGDDVFLTTNAQLTSPRATESSAPSGEAEIYDARVDGGFPSPSAAGACTEATCRPSASSSGSPAFTTPQSAMLGAAGFEEQAPAVATIAIGKIASRQRRAFARTGRLALAVHTSAPAALTVRVTATIHATSVLVAHGSVRLAKATTALIPISLNRLARRQLARTGTLTLRIEAGAAGDTATSLTLTLHRPIAATSGAEASPKRSHA